MLADRGVDASLTVKSVSWSRYFQLTSAIFNLCRVHFSVTFPCVLEDDLDYWTCAAVSGDFMCVFCPGQWLVNNLWLFRPLDTFCFIFLYIISSIFLYPYSFTIVRHKISACAAFKESIWLTIFLFNISIYFVLLINLIFYFNKMKPNVELQAMMT